MLRCRDQPKRAAGRTRAMNTQREGQQHPAWPRGSLCDETKEPRIHKKLRKRRERNALIQPYRCDRPDEPPWSPAVSMPSALLPTKAPQPAIAGRLARPRRHCCAGRAPASPADSPIPSVRLRSVNIYSADDAGNRRALALIGTLPASRGSQHASLLQPRTMERLARVLTALAGCSLEMRTGKQERTGGDWTLTSRRPRIEPGASRTGRDADLQGGAGHVCRFRWS
jgi:hypothetical protein